jgi:hypothetical protein
MIQKAEQTVRLIPAFACMTASGLALKKSALAKESYFREKRESTVARFWLVRLQRSAEPAWRSTCGRIIDSGRSEARRFNAT